MDIQYNFIIIFQHNSERFDRRVFQSLMVYNMESPDTSTQYTFTIIIPRPRCLRIRTAVILQTSIRARGYNIIVVAALWPLQGSPRVFNRILRWFAHPTTRLLIIRTLRVNISYCCGQNRRVYVCTMQLHICIIWIYKIQRVIVIIIACP